MPAQVNSVLVIGGGPAGLHAAEVANAAGARVVVCDAQRSVGRKFLVAGRGGLNLTHGEPVENFPARYEDEPGRWRDLLQDFGPTEIRAWAADLGVETYVGTSGRVFPRGQKAAGLLRGWVRRLRERGVEFRTGMRLLNLARQQDSWSAEFKTATADTLTLPADSIVLALGGASWPETGSDGMWPEILAAHGIEITPWQPSNCGWNVNWSSELLARAEGLPLKNLTVTACEESVSGELLITRHGLEGGAIYRLGRKLRAMPNPSLTLDFKPQLTDEALHERISNLPAGEWFRAWKLSKAVIALLKTQSPNDLNDAARAIALVKNFKIVLTGPRPIAEAISSAGGVAWRELDENLMVRKMPGILVAGEMIDWEAPTGGYLLQGCFATASRAGRAAALFRSVEKR
jgi:uncharacterized flavoprotein (TIGR03862 family)